MTRLFRVKERSFRTAKRAHEHARNESKSGKRVVVLQFGMAIAAYRHGKAVKLLTEDTKTDAIIRHKFAEAATGAFWEGGGA